MQSMSLAGSWQLQQVGEPETIAAVVPGGVHTDLLAAGKIPDPFFGTNELDVMWVAERDWRYTRSFTVPQSLLDEDRLDLVCDGLDTLGQVELNGTVLGRFENMFRQYRWDVKDIVRPGENTLVFTFDSIANFVAEAQKERPMLGVSAAIPGGPHARKAPCQFGWDWGPMLATMGIWKDLRIEAYREARLVDAHVRQHVQDGSGVIDITAQVEQWGTAQAQVTALVSAPDGKQFQAQGSIEGGQASLQVVVPQAQLWWPNGYGDQPLYGVEVSLQSGGAVLDTRTYQVGFRTLALRRDPDQWGEEFVFVVNGTPIFAKGADWIPADSFPTRISNAYMEGLIRDAAAVHMNMLRVWGGGFYEEERFYDLCDRYGILVWQDFVFACSIYPDTPEFFDNVRQEAVENVRRLRHRASLALWCGNNEMEQGWVDWGWNKPANGENQRLKAAYDRMFHQMLPGIVAVEDPDRPYWPSSASSGIPFAEPNSQARGDCHYWDVWHGRKPFTAYRETYPRFMSEFGFQSLPPLETVRTYADEKDWNMTSFVMEHHQRSYKGNGLMISQMTDTFRMPKDFSKLVYLSMLLQAEGIRYGVEHWRRHKNRVSGILYWQLNDCWPVASWSSIDYHGRWKALHYLARRFYAPVLLSVEENATTMNVWVTSDLPQGWSGQVEWALMDLSGAVLESGAEQVVLAGQESRQVVNKTFDLPYDAQRKTIFVSELVRDGECLSRSVTLFAPNKHLELAEPHLQVDVRLEQDAVLFTVQSGTLARFVELALEGVDVVFSDNYFDVLPGKPVTVRCALPEGWDASRAREALRVTSLYDSFA